MTIKIVDEGGGIRRSDLQRVWSYMYSTAPKPTASQLTGVPLDHMSGKTKREEKGGGGAMSVVLLFCGGRCFGAGVLAFWCWRGGERCVA